MDSKEMAPGDIERRSFEIITEELGGRTFHSDRIVIANIRSALSRRSKNPS